MARTKTLVVDGADIRSREFRVTQAIASARLEGMVTPASWKRVLDRYSAGEINDEELVVLANKR